MKPRTLIQLFYSLGWALVLLAVGGCGIPKHTQKVNGYLITLYSNPRIFQTGEMQLSLRIQDRDFRILTDRSSSLVVINQQSEEQQAVALKAGPGKDVRGWVNFPRPGRYTVLFSFAEDASGQTITACFPIKVQ